MNPQIYFDENYKIEVWRDENFQISRSDDLPSIIKYDRLDKEKVQEWYKNGVLHRDNDLPASIEINSFGNKTKKWYQHGTLNKIFIYHDCYNYEEKISEQWFKNGELHRDEDLPAMTTYRGRQINEEGWYQNGKLHRENNPARITYKGEQKVLEEWYQHGKLHRAVHLPAFIEYDDKKIKNEKWYTRGELTKDISRSVIAGEDKEYITESWYKDGEYHRDGNLPAVVLSNGDTKVYEAWYKNGKLHRDVGPATCNYMNGELKCEMWFRNGVIYNGGFTPISPFTP